MAKLPRYLFPSDYMADPSANVFNGRFYIYPSHDWDAGECFDDDGGHFQMKDYHVLSWDDIENGEVTDHGVILDVKDVPWAEKQMWDNDCVEKDGKYYLIFSAKAYDGVFRLGVAVADKPEGPFKPMEKPIRGSFSIDPCVFKDDDGKIYTYFGGLWGGQLQWWRPLPNGLAPIFGKYGDRTDSSTSVLLLTIRVSFSHKPTVPLSTAASFACAMMYSSLQRLLVPLSYSTRMVSL